MKSALITLTLGLGIAFTASTAYAATVGNPAGDGLNGGLVTGTPGSWYFNWTSQSQAEHHVPTGFTGGFATDYTTKPGTASPSPVNGTLSYSGAVQADNSVVPMGLDVTGYNFFNDNNPFPSDGTSFTFAHGTQEKIRHDFWSGRNHNGIGVMTEGTNSEEQVNYLDNVFEEYLLLSFDQSINLRGFDFASGEHHACGPNTNCGGFELFTLNGATAKSVFSQELGGASGVDFVVFGGDGFVGQEFLIRATGPLNSTLEKGWYLSGVAGDTSVVPVPPALSLFLGALAGLAGLGAMKRRRKAA